MSRNRVIFEEAEKFIADVQAALDRLDRASFIGVLLVRCPLCEPDPDPEVAITIGMARAHRRGHDEFVSTWP